jgi:hypothetical protein
MGGFSMWGLFRKNKSAVPKPLKHELKRKEHLNMAINMFNDFHVNREYIDWHSSNVILADETQRQIGLYWFTKKIYDVKFKRETTEQKHILLFEEIENITVSVSDYVNDNFAFDDIVTEEIMKEYKDEHIKVFFEWLAEHPNHKPLFLLLNGHRGNGIEILFTEHKELKKWLLFLLDCMAKGHKIREEKLRLEMRLEWEDEIN